MKFRADATSRQNIRKLVMSIRQTCKLENDLYFPILRFVENVLPSIFDDFTFEVLPAKEMGECHGQTFPDEHIIRIRSDVYEGAADGIGRDRLTIAHEVGHLLLHHTESISFCRLSKNQKLPAYEDPEWQANCFGGELLAPSTLIKGMTVSEVAEKCGVSLDAAEIQLKHS